MERDPNKKVALTYRLPERLRARLEVAAKETDTSLNNEITDRLEKSFSEPDIVERMVGGPHIASLLQMIAAAIRYCEFGSGYKYTEDSDTQRQCRLAINSILDRFMQEGIRNPDPSSQWKIIIDGIERPDLESGHVAGRWAMRREEKRSQGGDANSDNK